MSSNAFAKLAAKHSELEPLLEEVAAILRAGAADSLFDPEFLASTLGDARVPTLFALLEEHGVVGKEGLVECPRCDALVAEARYEAILEEDEEYACESCGEDLSGGAPRVTRYRLTAPPPPLPDREVEWPVVFVSGDRGGASRHRLATVREFEALSEALAASRLSARMRPAHPVYEATRASLVAAHRQRPAVLHIAGHGTERSLAFIRDQGALITTTEVLASDFATILQHFTDRVVLCVLNTCDSLALAEHLVARGVVDAAIGWPGKPSDDDAITFTRELYAQLGEGRDLAGAVGLSAQACNTPPRPELRVADCVDASVSPFVSKEGE